MRIKGNFWSITATLGGLTLLVGLLFGAVVMAAEIGSEQDQPNASSTGVTVGAPIQPALVDLRDIEPGAPVKDGEQNREQRRHNRISVEEEEALRKQALEMPPDENVQIAPLERALGSLAGGLRSGTTTQEYRHRHPSKEKRLW